MTETGIRVCIDRGGTFTDCIAFIPSGHDDKGERRVVVKLLSVDPNNYSDAPTEGIRRILEQVTGIPHPRNKPLDTSQIGMCSNKDNIIILMILINT